MSKTYAWRFYESFVFDNVFANAFIKTGTQSGTHRYVYISIAIAMLRPHP